MKDLNSLLVKLATHFDTFMSCNQAFYLIKVFHIYVNIAHANVKHWLEYFPILINVPRAVTSCIQITAYNEI